MTAANQEGRRYVCEIPHEIALTAQTSDGRARSMQHAARSKQWLVELKTASINTSKLSTDRTLYCGEDDVRGDQKRTQEMGDNFGTHQRRVLPPLHCYDARPSPTRPFRPSSSHGYRKRLTYNSQLPASTVQGTNCSTFLNGPRHSSPSPSCTMQNDTTHAIKRSTRDPWLPMRWPPAPLHFEGESPWVEVLRWYRMARPTRGSRM